MKVAGGTGVAIADDAVWVTVGGETLRKIDPETGKVLLEVKTPGPFTSAPAPSGFPPSAASRG